MGDSKEVNEADLGWYAERDQPLTDAINAAMYPTPEPPDYPAPPSPSQPIDRPCSACGDGDIEMKYHTHEDSPSQPVTAKSDVCKCGDCRSQHENGKKCRVCGNSRAPYDGCLEFRLSHHASPSEQAHWDKFHGTQSAQPVAGEWPQRCDLCGKQMESADDRMMWHGLGNCVEICTRCNGSGEEPKESAQPVAAPTPEEVAKEIDSYYRSTSEGWEKRALFVEGRIRNYTASLEARVGEQKKSHDDFVTKVLQEHGALCDDVKREKDRADTLAASLREVRETLPKWQDEIISLRPLELATDSRMAKVLNMIYKEAAALLSRLSTDSGKAESAREEGSGKF